MSEVNNEVRQLDPKEAERLSLLAKKPPYVNADQFLAEHMKADTEGEATVNTDPSNKEATPVTTPSPDERYKERYDQLKGHHDRTINDYKKRIEALEAQVRNASQKSLKLPRTQEELEEFKKDYPDVYATMQAVALLEQQNLRKEMAEELKVLHGERVQSKREKAEAALSRAHPDWEELRDDPKFHEWAQVQPAAIQDWLYNNSDDAHLAVRAIDLYKLEKGLNKPKQEKPKTDPKAAILAVDTRGSAAPVTENIGGKKIWTEAEIAKLKPAEFAAKEEEIMLAMREGRVR